MKRIVTCLLLAGMTGPVLAQDAPEVIRLSIRANGAPIPALKFKLMPDARDVKSGNAALDYYRAFSPEWWGHIQRQPTKYWDDLSKLLKAPLKEINRQSVQDYPVNSGMMRQVDRGARRETCDWELASRVAEEGYATLIPDVQGIRNFASFLALRTRLEISEGKIDQAILTLQTGFQLARHVGESHTLINHLVGVACAMILTQQLEELIQQPNAPNLYWALSQLPRPFFDLSRPLAGERLMLDRELAGLRELEGGPVTEEQANKALTGLIERSANWGKIDREQLMAQAHDILPQAKENLIRAGRSPADIEKMPMVQVVLLHARHEIERLQDDVMKWMSLPYAEGREGLRRALEADRMAKERKEVLSVVIDFRKSAEKVILTRMRMDRRIAALRCVEAIKLHVADNGHLPKSLDEIKAAPIPLDPMIDKPFEYQREGETAILTAPLYGMPTGNGWRYEIRLQK